MEYLHGKILFTGTGLSRNKKCGVCIDPLEKLMLNTNHIHLTRMWRTYNSPLPTLHGGNTRGYNVYRRAFGTFVL